MSVVSKAFNGSQILVDRNFSFYIMNIFISHIGIFFSGGFPSFSYDTIMY